MKAELREAIACIVHEGHKAWIKRLGIPLQNLANGTDGEKLIFCNVMKLLVSEYPCLPESEKLHLRHETEQILKLLEDLGVL